MVRGSIGHCAVVNYPMPSAKRKAVRSGRRSAAVFEFNPNSFDTQFGILNTRMDLQDVLLKEIKTQTTTTNGRVTALETQHSSLRGFLRGARWSAGIAAGLVTLTVNLLLKVWH